MSQLEQPWSDIEPSTLHGISGSPVRRVRSLSELDEIQRVWDPYSLQAKWASPMLHHLWARTYADAYNVDGRLEVIIAGSGQSTAIAPLFRPRGTGKRLELIGVKELY